MTLLKIGQLKFIQYSYKKKAGYSEKTQNKNNKKLK